MAEKSLWGSKASSLARGITKTIDEDKLKAFNIGNMNMRKGMSKKEQDDMRKRKEQEEAINAYKDFVESFEDAGKGINKAWVKGGVVNPEKSSSKSDRNSSSSSSSSKIYKPTSKLAELASTFSSVKSKESDRDRDNYESSARKQEKKKTNLEMFKDELKSMQEERQMRHKTKQIFGLVDDKGNKPKAEEAEISSRVPSSSSGGYTYVDDVQTTNIYLGNINPKMTEQQLCEAFGKHGPLASVKIMWPRSEEERARGRNCGFVAFMNRRDAERAMTALEGKELMNFEMKLGWGKPVPIPPHPVYIPQSLAELTVPPPPSGLPFNAQPRPSLDQCYDQSENDNNSFEKTLANAVVKVVIPTERNLLCIIHHMIEFVVREGPMFEAMIMNKEINNPMFRFLFENQSPPHIYYRWKLFSILQGESPHQWRTEPFVMFDGGSLWQPPPMNPYTQGMPEELVRKSESRAPVERTPTSQRHHEEEEEDSRESSEQLAKRGQLSESQRDRLEDMLRDLTPERTKIGDAMVWCLEHADASEEIVECIAESLSILQTPLPKKIARLFLVSDILYNSSVKMPHVSSFRRHFESKLLEIMKDVHDTYKRIEARLKAEQFKQRVMMCFRAWEDWAIYPNDLLIHVQNIFLGLVPGRDEEKEDDVVLTADLDGVPLADLGEPVNKQDDIDGKPLDEQADLLAETNGKEKEHLSVKANAAAAKFKAAEMASVDESLLIQQAVTSSKWDFFEQQPEDDKDKDYNDDIDGMPMEDDTYQREQEDRDALGESSEEDVAGHSMSRLTNEERRLKLREIELKVIRYQDELEAGKRSRKSGMTISEQVEHYRRKLLQKDDEREQEKKRDEERDKVKEWEKMREKDKGYDKGRGVDKSKSGSKRERSSSLERSYYSNRSPSPPSSRRRLSRSPATPHSSSNQDMSPRRQRSPVSSSRRSRSRSPGDKKRHKHKKSSRH